MKLLRTIRVGIALGTFAAVVSPASTATAIQYDTCDSRNVIVRASVSRCFAWSGEMTTYIQNTTGLHSGMNDGFIIMGAFGYNFYRWNDYYYRSSQPLTTIAVHIN